jgi:hypothetical protein
MGSAGLPVFISETRALFQFKLNLLPMEDTGCFDLVQDRGGERKLFEGCRIQGFELRIAREEAIKLKLDIFGEHTPVVYPYTETFVLETGASSAEGAGEGSLPECFYGDSVKYRINGQEYRNIYGLTLSTRKKGSTRTELWIKRSIEQGPDIPEIIEELTVTAQLLRDKYEARHFGTFRITAKHLVLAADETDINSAGAVIGPLRYYVSGTISAEVFTSAEENII